MKKLPIGISDFKKLIEDGYYYVDKTLFIQELTEVAGEVLLITRPRRFGKTLNLSMLRYFFEKTNSDTSYLFANSSIWQQADYRSLQGQYPVISLTFKDIKEDTWESAYKKVREIIAKEFNRHLSIIQDSLSDYYLKKYIALSMEEADEESYSTSLFLLTEVLHTYYKKRVIVLIDEYDAPIHEGYTHKYYPDVIKFFRSIFTSVFKDNVNLERGILTGILRAAKEGIFSGLNNLSSYTLTNTQFQDKFGFTQLEVQQLLQDRDLSDKLSDVQAWYNGYLCGKTTIYNPWSLLRCAQERGLLQLYWVNTSNNALIKSLIALADIGVKADLELLLMDKTIDKEIEEAVIFPNIEHSPTALWSLLLFAGYLTYTKLELQRGKTICTLAIPNEEIKILYESLIKNIFETTLTESTAHNLLTDLTTGDVASFAQLLQEFISSSMSVYDVPGNEPEKSYHLFVLGLLVMLSHEYEIKSNRESGLGRYDIMIIPKKHAKLGIAIEFKKATAQETLEIAAQRALEQIKEKRYVQELKDRGVTNILLLGIAFIGKQLFVASGYPENLEI